MLYGRRDNVFLRNPPIASVRLDAKLVKRFPQPVRPLRFSSVRRRSAAPCAPFARPVRRLGTPSRLHVGFDHRKGPGGACPRKIGPRGCRRIGRPVAHIGVQRQARGKSGGETVTTACTPARATCNAASWVWSREVFSTVPPSPLRPSSTLSAVNLRTSAKSAAVPG